VTQHLVQAFFLHLLEKQSLRHAQPERGRFRSFLLASLKHLLLNRADRERAQKRGGGRTSLSLDMSLRREVHMRVLAFAGLNILLFAVPSAIAQSAAVSFVEISVRPGDDVEVTSRSGETVRGRVAEISGTTLRMYGSRGTTDVVEADTLRIDRLGDPIRQGLGIGAAVGGGVGAAMVAGCGGYCDGGGKKAGVVLAAAGIGAGIGALVDLAIRGRTRVFDAAPSSTVILQLTPSVASGRRALHATLRF
jgi:hypothetical protein